MFPKDRTITRKNLKVYFDKALTKKNKTVGGCIMGLMVKILIIVFSSIFPLLNCALNILFLEKQYFLSEHTNILPEMMVRAYFPRFMKWSLTRLTQELVNTPLESIEPGKVKSINT